jgi:hypothetical protein
MPTSLLQLVEAVVAQLVVATYVLVPVVVAVVQTVQAVVMVETLHVMDVQVLVVEAAQVHYS